MRVVDLSFPISTDMTTYPASWHPEVRIDQLGVIEREGRATSRIVLGSHTGTHVDAPCHFINEGCDVAGLDLNVLVGQAAVLDLTPCPLNEAIDAERLDSAVSDGPIDRLLLRTDWSDHWTDSDYYSAYPFLTEDAVEWIMQRGVRLLGMDTPSPDDPRNGRLSKSDSPNHHRLLQAGVVLVEYLTSLQDLSHSNVEFICLPMSIVGADGSPARCVAIERSVNG